MIFTITLSPSLDYIVYPESLQIGAVNRTKEEMIFVGGKGINVSRILSELGITNQALGFISGFTGEEIERLVKVNGVVSDFIKVEEGFSRINIKLKGREETEINGNGPNILKKHIDKLFEKINKLEEGDFLIMAGSIPKCVSKSIYGDMMESLKSKNINFVVDTAKEALIHTLKYRPFLIKPNHHELGELFQREISTKEEIITYGQKLQQMGAQNVLVSRASEGAILLTKERKIFESKGIKGEVRNSVGAGDSMVAGFIAGYINRSYEEALKMGIAAGNATAFSDDLATRKEIEEIRKLIK